MTVLALRINSCKTDFTLLISCVNYQIMITGW